MNDNKKVLTTLEKLEKATEQIIKTMATKDDLKGFVTKNDLKNELSKYATKDDLHTMRELITEDITDVIKEFLEVIGERKADKKDLEKLEKRVVRSYDRFNKP